MLGSAHDRAGALGDSGGAGQAVQADRDVPECGHDLGGCAGAGLRAVLVVGHVAHVVDLILDGPMPADDLRELGGAGLVEVEVSDCVDGLDLGLRAADAASALQADRLAGAGGTTAAAVAARL